MDERRTQNEGPWFWKTLLASGPPLSGFRFIRGLWIYRSEEKALYLHLEHDADPARYQWSAVWTREESYSVVVSCRLAVSRRAALRRACP